MTDEQVDPYQSEPALQVLDVTIASTMAVARRIASKLVLAQLSDVQLAAAKLIPGILNLGLGQRELIRTGHLYSAAVLSRPLFERAVTLRFLHRQPERASHWNRGWKYKQRPSLAMMCKMIDDDRNQPKTSDLRPYSTMLSSLNGLVHGEPDSSEKGIVYVGGQKKLAIGPIYDRPDLAIDIADLSISSLAIVAGVGSDLFEIG